MRRVIANRHSALLRRKPPDRAGGIQIVAGKVRVVGVERPASGEPIARHGIEPVVAGAAIVHERLDGAWVEARRHTDDALLALGRRLDNRRDGQAGQRRGRRADRKHERATHDGRLQLGVEGLHAQVDAVPVEREAQLVVHQLLGREVGTAGGRQHPSPSLARPRRGVDGSSGRDLVARSFRPRGATGRSGSEPEPHVDEPVPMATRWRYRSGRR